MLAPHIKEKVDKLWDRFWSAGITNPLVAVEQITYLVFLKRLESIDLQRQQRGYPCVFAGHESCKWSYIRPYPSPHFLEVFKGRRTLREMRGVRGAVLRSAV
jgi:hypothetical protein